LGNLIEKGMVGRQTMENDEEKGGSVEVFSSV
jgi:hypothetical protein